MINKIITYVNLIPKLGYRNVAYMLWYRLSLKLGIRKGKFLEGKPIRGTFFSPSELIKDYPDSWRPQLRERADKIIKGYLTWFHYHDFQTGNPPNWFQNPFDGSILNDPNKHWTELSDFDLNTGDVKIIWEPSRFDWLTDLARAFRVFGDRRYLDALNIWLGDWSLQNPKNIGPNWKCGQETAIRLMKLITTSQILDQNTKAPTVLQQMVFEHIERIAGNINYAVAQDNNHGTSEAAGLYIGAVWLLKQQNQKYNNEKLTKWKKKGREILENRVLKLIAPQGTFSQRSVTYHRVVVDTMSWVFFNMELLSEPDFHSKIKERLQKLGEWQYKFIVSSTGDSPNLGSNDGAMLETLHGCDYRDFRPSTQLFFGTLNQQRIFKEGIYDESLYWKYPRAYQSYPLAKIDLPEAEILDKQFLILRTDEVKLFMKIPENSFRPTASDAFHIDVWKGDANILCDSGSYSYNAGAETNWYKSVEAHNTLQFGNQQQMPKISRFLFSHWLKAKEVEPLTFDKTIYWKGYYRDYKGNKHYRRVEWDTENNQIIIEDKVLKQTKEPLSLRWHSEFDIFDSGVLKISSDNGEELRPEYETTGRSLYYLQKDNKITFKFTEDTDCFITTIKGK